MSDDAQGIEASAPLRERVSPRTRAGLAVAGSAAGLGVLGDLLLRSDPWGINLTLWAAALVASCALLARRHEAEGAARAWLPLALGVGALMAWRDAPVLKALDLGALAVLLGMGMMQARGGSLRESGPGALALGLARSARDAAVGAGYVVGADVRWDEVGGGGRMRLAAAVLRGAAIALPLLMVFGALLVAADAAFERAVGRVFAVDAPALAGHALLAGAVAWVAAGVLRTVALGSGGAEAGPARPKWLSVGMVEAGVALGLVNLLFLAFVAVQVPYFFGSAAVLREPGTSTFAEYARRGFFELVTVAGLVLPLLLFADWVVRRERRSHVRAFRALGGVTVALLFVIMASGMHRMRLYWGAYGLTELRLYTTAFMVWLAVVLGLFAWTVLRGRRDRFALGAALAALEMVVLLHVLNPDALIVRVNAGRPDATMRFDAPYAASLGADAVPALVAALASGEGAGRCRAAHTVLGRWGTPGDWRSWSLGRARAVAAVRARRAELEAIACGPALSGSRGAAASPASPSAGTAVMDPYP